jgi:hypothetical protein
MFGTASRFSTRPKSVDALCQELGWCIDERDGDTVMLNFQGDSVSPMRHVLVVTCDDGDWFCFIANTRAEYPEHAVPNGLMSSLLHRNKESFGSWYATERRHGLIGFACHHSAHAAGLDADTFKYICNRLLSEVGNVERELHRKGLLQAE